MASENYFDSNRVFTVILCLQAYLDRGYFGRCSNYLPLLFTRIYNATESYRNVIEIDNDEIIISCHALYSFYDHGEYKQTF